LKLALLILASIAAHAQVHIRFTPEPMAVPTAALARAKDLGRWQIEACNDGAQSITITSERLDMAAGPIRFIDAEDTLLVLTSAQQRSTAGTLAKIGSILGETAAIGAAFARVNPLVSTAVALGSAAAPQLVTIAKGQIPTITPLLTSTKYPLILAPGQCFTDHRFAGKMKDARVVNGTIGAPEPAETRPHPEQLGPTVNETRPHPEQATVYEHGLLYANFDIWVDPLEKARQ